MKTVEIGLSRPAIQNGAERVGFNESEPVRKIQESIAYMKQHLDGTLRVATLAARASLSPSHFFALFKRQIGYAPIDYFIRLRMQQACRLLDETRLSVKEVAAALGYDDPFYFSRIFKSVNRVAPSEYRLMKNGAKEAVRSCGIALCLSPVREFGTGMESNGFGPLAGAEDRSLRGGPVVTLASYRDVVKNDRNPKNV